MMFNPYSKLNDLESDLKFLRETKSYGVSITKNLRIHDSTEIKSSLLKEGVLKLVPFFEGYHEYKVENDVARMYASLKLIWGNIINPIQIKYLDVITQIKKSNSFNRRQDFDKYLRLTWEAQETAMLKIINLIRNKKTTRKNILNIVLDVQFNMGVVVDFLCSKKVKKKFEADQYRLFLFQNGKRNYCMDLVTSKIFKVNKKELSALRVFIGEQSAFLKPKIVVQIKKLIGREMVKPFKIIEKKILSTEKLTDLIFKVFQDYNLDTIPEKYVWNQD